MIYRKSRGYYLILKRITIIPYACLNDSFVLSTRIEPPETNSVGGYFFEIRLCESVLLLANLSSLINRYWDVLGLNGINYVEDDYRFCNLETASGIMLGAA